MAPRIRVLDEGVINRIAAGEVVERPASVVKELVENSIDAAAGNIRVDIENGGKKLIRVRDNGSGMSGDDAFLALERHATSKINSEKDLVGIATMGFRGEALASISAVSRLKLMTSDGADDAGSEIVIEGGVLNKSQPVGMARGTLLEVRNLFYNVPVRRKFLKGTAIEAGHISELITRFALGFPSIGFTYSENNRIRMDAPPTKSTLDRIHSLYSRDVCESLVEVDHSVGNVNIQGYVARPPYARSDRRSVLTFVNGRSVRDRLISGAVNRAFTNLMERGRFPLAILFMQLPPDQLDVNVHPQKAEVRFVKPGAIFEVIVDGVHEALTGAPFRPPPGSERSIFPKPPNAPLASHLKDEREPEEQPQTEPAEPHPQDTSPIETPHANVPDMPRHEASASSSPAEISADLRSTVRQEESEGRFSSLGILGRLPGSFVVLFNDAELIVMDHHAAHERVLFEDLVKAEAEGNRGESQGLLIPKVLEYSSLEARVLAAHLELLQRVGFQIEEFGERAFVIKGVPSRLGNADMDELFQELIEVMLQTGLQGDPAKLNNELLKNMACKAAAKESKAMRPEEIKALLTDLDRVGSIEVCPHGRPMTVRFPFSEIRRKMGRK
jgi:DNA mismatch repair protein MutL